LLAFTGALLSSGGEQRAKVLTNQPPVASIVRFEVARMPPKGAVWQRLSQKDGEFILSATQGLHEWKPKWPGGGAPGCMLPPSNDFSVRAITKSGKEYYVTFTIRAELVWVGSQLLEVPTSTSTQIVQRVQAVLKKK
jgi:hypothetical protein